MRKFLCFSCLMLLSLSLFANVGEGISDLFSMDTVDPLIDVLHPNGGETLLSNQQTMISWLATDGHLTGNTIEIKLSPNNGANWQMIVQNETNDGGYIWTVPFAYTMAALIKIQAIDDFGNYGEATSDAVFTIEWQGNYGISNIFSLDTVLPELELTTPDGGEEWYIGDFHDILWTASDNHFSTQPINIYFSASGNDFTAIAENQENNGSYNWEIPSEQTNSARIKIIVADTYGNTVADSSATSFTISYVPPDAPTDVYVDTSNGIDAVISWEPVSTTIYGTPISPDGYIVLYNEIPSDDHDYYYFLGATSDSTYTHNRVAEFRDQMFYMVIAYKDYRGDIEPYLTSLENRINKKIAWRDLKKEWEMGKVRGER